MVYTSIFRPSQQKLSIMNEKKLLLKIASMKEDEPLCHTSDPCYKQYLKLCRNLKEKNFLIYRKPFGGGAVGNYKGTSFRHYPPSPGFLIPKLTYDGLIEVDRIHREVRNRYIAIAGVCISLTGLLVPVLYKYLPHLYKCLIHFLSQ